MRSHYFYFMCMCVPLLEFMFTMRRPEEGVKFPGVAVTGHYQLTSMRPNLGPLQKHYLLLTSGPSFQPFFYN